jgi:TniQ
MYGPPNHFGKFLLTPQIHEYESFRGFITRVAVHNESIPLVRPLLKTLTDASKSIPMLAQLTNTDPEILKSHGALLVEGTANHMMARFGNTHIPSSYLRHTTRHICPQCLAEEGISMGYWDLQLYSVCHRHGLRLINECSNCKKGFEWHIGRTDICKCGTPLAEMSAKAVPGADGVGLGKVLAAAYMHSLDQNRETSAHATSDKRQAISFCHLTGLYF